MTPVDRHIATIHEAARARRETYPQAQPNCGEALVAEIERLRTENDGLRTENGVLFQALYDLTYSNADQEDFRRAEEVCTQWLTSKPPPGRSSASARSTPTPAA